MHCLCLPYNEVTVFHWQPSSSDYIISVTAINQLQKSGIYERQFSTLQFSLN